MIGERMIKSDTIKLLEKCSYGIEMGVLSIDDTVPYINEQSLKDYLLINKKHHLDLKEEINMILNDYGVVEKNINTMIKKISSLKTNSKLLINKSQEKIASLLIDGCTMGIKSISKYLNHYPSANDNSKDIAERLIDLEEELSIRMRKYL